MPLSLIQHVLEQYAKDRLSHMHPLQLEESENTHKLLQHSLSFILLQLTYDFTNQVLAMDVMSALDRLGMENNVKEKGVVNSMQNAHPKEQYSYELFGNKQSMVSEWLSITYSIPSGDSQKLLEISTHHMLQVLAVQRHRQQLSIVEIANEIRQQPIPLDAQEIQSITDLLEIPTIQRMRAQIPVTFGFQSNNFPKTKSFPSKGGNFLRSVLPILILILVATMFYYFYRLQ